MVCVGVHIEADLTQSTNTTLTPQYRTGKEGVAGTLLPEDPQEKPSHSETAYVHHCSIESTLTYYMCVWFASCTVAERKHL